MYFENFKKKNDFQDFLMIFWTWAKKTFSAFHSDQITYKCMTPLERFPKGAPYKNTEKLSSQQKHDENYWRIKPIEFLIFSIISFISWSFETHTIMTKFRIVWNFTCFHLHASTVLSPHSGIYSFLPSRAAFSFFRSSKAFMMASLMIWVTFSMKLCTLSAPAAPTISS